MQTFTFQENIQPLSKKEFDQLSGFIYDQCGIKMPPIKKTMLETRLRKRLKANGYTSYGQYCDFLFSSNEAGQELIHMIDVVTTNKTDFFREPAQFSYLSQKVLPQMLHEYGAGYDRKLRIWSAGCSTGEEPYTMSIVLNEFAQDKAKYDYSIFATDISTRVLEEAVLGIYDSERIDIIPLQLKKKYFLKGKDSKKDLVRVIPQLRKKITFQRLNFLDNDLGVKEKMDVIFCRNVIIYFDKETQEMVIRKLLSHLIPGGYLFLGHSETIFKTDLSIEQVSPSSYRKLR